MSKIPMCKNCKFFGEDEIPEEEYFACKRYAPRILHGSGQGWSSQKFPKVEMADWCGEFSEK